MASLSAFHAFERGRNVQQVAPQCLNIENHMFEHVQTKPVSRKCLNMFKRKHGPDLFKQNVVKQ